MLRGTVKVFTVQFRVSTVVSFFIMSYTRIKTYGLFSPLIQSSLPGIWPHITSLLNVDHIKYLKMCPLHPSVQLFSYKASPLSIGSGGGGNSGWA